jgi:Ca-activated chloride channel family protein
MGFKTRKIPRDLLLDPPPRRRRWWLLPAILLAGLALLLVTIDVRADAFSEAESGQLLIKDVSGWQQAVHLETSVNIMVTGIVARTTMRQSFRNDSESWQDAVYVFPLPDSAAIFDMEMHIGERIIRSRIREREQARKIYREAEAEGRKAALTEQQRPNLFTQSIANIQPGEAIEVILVYIETVRYDNGRFSLRLPLTLTPRYIPGHAAAEYLGATSPGWAPPTDQVPDAPEITPHMHPPATETAIINPVSINITLDTGLVIADISSPYHEIDVTRQTGIHRIVLTHGKVSMDRDFVIQWRPAAGSEPEAAVFRESIGVNDYAQIMVAPPSAASDYRISREVIFVVDTSGSMSGTSIVQARKSLQAALDSLQPGDRFNMIGPRCRSHRQMVY